MALGVLEKGCGTGQQVVNLLMFYPVLAASRKEC